MAKVKVDCRIRSVLVLTGRGGKVNGWRSVRSEAKFFPEKGQVNGHGARWLPT